MATVPNWLWSITPTRSTEKDSPSMKEAQELLRYFARKAKARFLTNESFPAQVVETLGTWCNVDAREGSWTQWQRCQNGTSARSRRLWPGRLQAWLEKPRRH
jgi:hypothetical protein